MMALLVGFTVPLANVVAVWALARHGESRLLAELARNPLILATAAGLGTNLLGLHAPEVLATTNRLGSASTALGLITVGAGLQLRAASARWAPWPIGGPW